MAKDSWLTVNPMAGEGNATLTNSHFIYAQIKNLRKKLKDAKANIEIKAVYGFGYKLIVE